MKRKLIYFVGLIIGMTLVVTPDLNARGGGRGGGRGGTGGGRSFQRSPSMSRASVNRPTARPSRPSASRPQTRPSSQIGNRPGSGQRPSRNTPARNDVQNFLQNRPAGGTFDRPNARPANRPGEKWAQHQTNRQDIGQKIRDQIRQDRPNRGDWFDRDFWDHHHHYPPYWDNNHNWWGLATAAGIGAWLNWRNPPVYYDYYYGDDGYYWGTSGTGTIETPATYSQQSEAIETASKEPSNDEWMPLGVFTMTNDKQNTAAPNFYIQLALNKEGLISGIFYNATTDITKEIEGLVDQASQRAAWKIADTDTSPIVETGLYNLTQPELPIRVYFPNGSTQDMLLVRVEA